MTIASELVPWLTVVVIMLCGTVVGVIAMRRLAPGGPAVTSEAERMHGETVVHGTEAWTTDAAVDATEPDLLSGAAAAPDVEGGAGDHESKRPHRFTPAGSISVVERAVAVEPVEPTPVRLDLQGTVAVVSTTDTEAERLGAVEMVPTPTPMTTELIEVTARENRLSAVEMVPTPTPMTTELIEVTARENRLSAVETVPTPVTMTTAGRIEVTARERQLGAVETAESTDEADTDVVCEYCGRDDFETAAQRNGHLRWCDAYDPDAAVTEADEGSEAGQQPDHATADATDEGIDVIATYAAVRKQLREELDISNRRTSQEFYHVCRSRGLDERRLAALERLTQAYETVQYSDNPDVNVDEIRTAAAAFGTVEQ